MHFIQIGDQLTCFVFIIIWMSVQSKKVVRGERKGLDGRDHGRRAISEDLVSVINDGLFFYEQVGI